MKKRFLFFLLIGIIISGCGNKTNETVSSINQTSTSESGINNGEEEGYWLKSEYISVTEDDLSDFSKILDKESTNIDNQIALLQKELKDNSSGIDVTLLYLNKNDFNFFEIENTSKSKNVSGTYNVNSDHKIIPEYLNKQYLQLENGKKQEIQKENSQYDMEFYQSYENRIYSIPNEEARKKIGENNICVVYSRITNDEGEEIEKLITDYKLKEEAYQSSNTSTEPSTTESAIQSKNSENDSDITHVSEKPSSEQIDILQQLAEQEFSNQYPYKGSKLKSILGVVQPWTESNGRWFYKVEAVIVNQANAKRETTVEIYIDPINATSGNVEIISY